MNNKEQVNVGIIGVGWFGEKHARVYQQMSGVKLVGVYDSDHERLETVSKNLEVKAYRTLEELLNEDSIKAVSICTTDQFHLTPTIAACQAEKHVLLEKPMALDLAECDQMISAASRAGIKLMIAHILRFNQRYQDAYIKIKNGEIGNVRHFYGRRNNPRLAARRLGARCGYHTIVYHNAVHDLDIMNWLSNDEVSKVFAVSQSGELEAEGYPMSDTVLSVLQFRNGVLGLLENCWSYPDSYPTLVDGATEITGSNGKIVLDFRNMSAIAYTGQGVNYFENPHWPEAEGRVTGDLRAEIEAFIRCIVEDLPVPVSGKDGRKAIAAANAIVRSLKSGQPEIVN